MNLIHFLCEFGVQDCRGCGLKRMALVSGGRSTLNPDAPLFVPAAYRQVEDFSPEWWQLVTTTTWFRDYWLSRHQDENGFYDNAEDEFGLDGNNVADLLPDTFDLDAGDYFSSLDSQFAGFAEEGSSPLLSNGMLANGMSWEGGEMAWGFVNHDTVLYKLRNLDVGTDRYSVFVLILQGLCWKQRHRRRKQVWNPVLDDFKLELPPIRVDQCSF